MRCHVNSRCDRQLGRRLQLMAPGVEKGRNPPHHATPISELILFFFLQGGGDVSKCPPPPSPQRCIHAAKPMLMRGETADGC